MKFKLKKLAPKALAALALVALATPAMAFNVSWHGDLDNRFSFNSQADLVGISSDTATYVNVDPSSLGGVDTKKKSDDSDFFGEIKYRLSLSASDDEQKVKGVVGFEFGSSKFGGEDLPLGGDQDNFELRWAYTDVELPFDPATRVKIGLQPVGYHPLLWSDNAAGIKVSRNAGPLAYSLGWFRNDVDTATGGEEKLENDDVYAADLTYAVSDNLTINTFALLRESGQEDIAGTTDTMDTQIWLGASASAQKANLSGALTAIYLTGELDAGAGTFAGGQDSLDRKGYLVHAEGKANYGRHIAKVGFLYTSGDDNPNDGDAENFDVIDMSTKGLGSAIIFESLADDNTLSKSPYLLDRGYMGAYAGVDCRLDAKTTVGASYFWHNTAEDVVSEDEIGHELVVRASYQLIPGVTANLNAGYLIAGDAMDELSSDGDADDVFRTDASIRLRF